jgi:hypothetical protein
MGNHCSTIHGQIANDYSKICPGDGCSVPVNFRAYLYLYCGLIFLKAMGGLLLENH